MAGYGRRSVAVVLEEPKRLALRELALVEPKSDDLVIEVEWSGISTGTERLLWTGDMPTFPGMGYPLVPGYETVGRVVERGRDTTLAVGDQVFVPGSRCFDGVHSLFGGSASTLVVPEKRVMRFDDALGEQGVLFALAATAYHALSAPSAVLPDLIVGHGVLGRLLARITLALGGAAPTVWERNSVRSGGALGYRVIDPEQDERKNYRAIYDVSGDCALLDTLISRLERGGEVVLAGFYSAPISFAFPPAFMREARLRVAAEWADADLKAVRDLVEKGLLSFDGLISHRSRPELCAAAYDTAFNDQVCLKMVLDWRNSHERV
jgi:bacteriochlorophyllide a dehydrogenase